MTLLSKVSDRKAIGVTLLKEFAERPETAKGKIFVMGTFQVEWLAPLLTEALSRRGLMFETRVGPFGQMMELIMEESSMLYQVGADEVVLVPDFEDWFSSLYDQPFMSEEEFDRLLSARLQEFECGLEGLLARIPGAFLTIVQWTPLRLPNGQILSTRSEVRGAGRIEKWQTAVRQLEEKSERIMVVDLDSYCREHGAALIRDDRFWVLARMRLTPESLGWMAEAVALHFAVRLNAPRKVIVTDLDQTLWGGVLGEVGGDRLQCGEEGVALAFREYQKWLLRAYHSGFVLAICSKNQESEALQTLDQHLGFVIRSKHFAAWRINWQDKASNLQELSKELGLGVDSFIFLDDHPAEREWVRQALPMVEVPELPADPALRLSLVRDLESVYRRGVTHEDQKRGQDYQTQRQRRELEKKAGTFEDYLVSLEQVLTLLPLSRALLPRAVQLGERTNQFNLTTRRYSAAEWEAFLSSGVNEVTLLSLRDRFDDQGITGLARICRNGVEARIDLLMISCRILGRRIEQVFLQELMRRLQGEGVTKVLGEYLPTSKNEPCRDFYSQNGFVRETDERYVFDLTRSRIPSLPGWIRLSE